MEMYIWGYELEKECRSAVQVGIVVYDSGSAIDPTYIIGTCT